MALIKDANSKDLMREAIVLDLGDLRREGDRLRAKAEEDAQEIIRLARIEAARTIEDANSRGMEEGRAEGAAQGRAAGFEAGRNEAYEAHCAELAAVISGWTAALDEFESRRDHLLRDARQDVVELAVRLAEAITRTSLETDRDAAARQLAGALELVLDATALRVEVNTIDESAVADALPSLLTRLGKSAHADVLVSGDVEPGGCRLIAGAGEIDATVEAQIRRMAETILRSGRSPRWSPGEPDEAAEQNDAAEQTEPGADPPLPSGDPPE